MRFKHSSGILVEQFLASRRFDSDVSLIPIEEREVDRDPESGRMNVGRIAAVRVKTEYYFWKLCQHSSSHRLFLALIPLTEAHQIQAPVLQIRDQLTFRRQRELRRKGEVMLDRELGFRQNADSFL